MQPPGRRRGAPRGHRARAARPVHRELAGVHQEPRHRRSTTTPAARRPHRLRVELAAPSTSPRARAVVASFPPERVHVLPLPRPGTPRDELWLRFARLVGIDPDPVRPVRQSSERRRWASSRPSRCAGSTATSSTSPPRSTGATTSAASSPTSSSSRAGARSSGRRRSGSRSSATAGTRRRRAYIAEQGFDVIGDVEDLRTPRRARRAPARPSRSPTPRWPRRRLGDHRARCCTTYATCATSAAGPARPPAEPSSAGAPRAAFPGLRSTGLRRMCVPVVSSDPPRLVRVIARR